MPSLCLLESPHAWHVVVFLASILEALLNLRVKLGLIAFDRKHVIGGLAGCCVERVPERLAVQSDSVIG